MNNINIEYLSERECKINGELWCKAEPTAVEAVKQPYFPKPELAESYLYIGANEKVMRSLWTDDVVDEYRYRTLNYWFNKSEAEAYIARYGVYLPDRLTLAIRRWKIANGVEGRYQWHGENNYYITYGRGLREWLIDQVHSQCILNVEYFSKVKTAERCLEDLQEYFADQLNEWNAESEGE